MLQGFLNDNLWNRVNKVQNYDSEKLNKSEKENHN